MYITKTTGTEGVVVFDSVLEVLTGGAILNKTRLKSDTEEVKAGALVYVADGVAQLVKTAECIDGGSATAVRIKKNHEFKVDDVVCLTTGGDASAITAIDTSSDDYDVISIDTLGSTPGDDDLLIEAAAATTSDDSALLYTPNGVLYTTVDVTNDNPGAAVVLRGTVREDALPFVAHALAKAALTHIIFN